MGFMDKIKGMFGGGIGAKVDKVVNASKQVLSGRIGNTLQGMAEDAAKDALADMATDVVNDQVNQVLGSNIPMRDRIVKMAVSKLVDKMWEESKDQLLGKSE